MPDIPVGSFVGDSQEGLRIGTHLLCPAAAQAVKRSHLSQNLCCWRFLLSF